MYGLQKDDLIVNVESLTINELNTGPAMRDFLVDAYQKSQPIVVIRHGVHVTLPQPRECDCARGASGCAGGASAVDSEPA